MSCDGLVSKEDLQNSKLDADSSSEYVSSDNPTLTTRLGKIKKTVQGMNDDNQQAIDDFNSEKTVLFDDFQNTADNLIFSTGFQPKGVFQIGATVDSAQDTLAYNGEEYNTTAGPFPYTVTQSTPDTDPADWFNVTLEARKTVARSLNVKDNEVIYHDDTVTLLDDVVAIYDKSANQKTWKIPTLDSAGKTIVSVIGNVLTTTGGSGSNTYTLIEAFKSQLTFDVDDYGAVRGAGNDSRQAFSDCVAAAKAANGIVQIGGHAYEVSASVEIAGVEVSIHPAAQLTTNPSTFFFTINGKGWSYTDRIQSGLPGGLQVTNTQRGKAAFSYDPNPATWDFGEQTTLQLDNYCNNRHATASAGPAVIRSYMETGRELSYGGSGGFLVGSWQVYDIAGTTPAGTTTEITPLSVGANMRSVEPSTGLPVTQTGTWNLYNDFVLHGSDQIVEEYYGGLCIGMTKLTDSTFVGGSRFKGSYGMSIVTNPNVSGFEGLVGKTGKTTYPMTAGLHIAGWTGNIGDAFASGGHTVGAARAYDKAIKLGGQGQGVWANDPQNQKSQFATAIEVNDYVNNGLVFNEPHPNFDPNFPAIKIESGAGMIQHGNVIRPLADLGTTCGAPGFRYSDMYSQNANNNTSDQRLKTAPEQLPDVVLDAIGDVEMISYKWLSDVEREADGGKFARKHCGIIAQQLKDAFSSRGLDAHEWGFFCYDEWDNQYENVEAVIEPIYKMENGKPVVDDNGEPIIIDHKVVTPEGKKLIKAAGNQYSIRYPELLTAVLAYERRERLRLEAKLNDLLAK